MLCCIWRPLRQVKSRRHGPKAGAKYVKRVDSEIKRWGRKTGTILPKSKFQKVALAALARQCTMNDIPAKKIEKEALEKLQLATEAGAAEGH